MSESPRPLRVLVIDDDELSREVFVLLLENEGYTVETAASGEDALEHLASAPLPPQVILADMQMPGVAGGELGQRLRACTPAKTILIAMSGSRPADDTWRGYDSFLLKPFSMQNLRAAITGGATSVANGSEIIHEDIVLNRETWSKLASTMRAEQLGRLYAMFLHDAVKRIGIMRQAKSAGDIQTYIKEAHAIKGSAGMVGASELHTLATSMEQYNSEDADYVASLDEFLIACERLRRILVAHKGMDQATVLSGEEPQ